MTPLDLFTSPYFWITWFMLGCYVSYRMISDKKWLDGNRRKVKLIIESVSAFASGYVFHSGVMNFIIAYHNELINYAWIIILFVIMGIVYDLLRGTKHIRTWGLLVILFLFGMICCALSGVLF